MTDILQPLEETILPGAIRHRNTDVSATHAFTVKSPEAPLTKVISLCNFPRTKKFSLAETDLEQGGFMPAIIACLVCGHPVTASSYHDDMWTSVLSTALSDVHETCFRLLREAQKDPGLAFISDERLERCLRDTFPFREHIQSKEKPEILDGDLERLVHNQYYAGLSMTPQWSERVFENRSRLLDGDTLHELCNTCETLLEAVVVLASFKFPERTISQWICHQKEARLYPKLLTSVGTPSSDKKLDTLRKALLNLEIISQSLKNTLNLAKIPLQGEISGTSSLNCLSRSLRSGIYDVIDLDQVYNPSQTLILSFRLFGGKRYISGIDISDHFVGYPSTWTRKLTQNSVCDLWVVYDSGGVFDICPEGVLDDAITQRPEAFCYPLLMDSETNLQAFFDVSHHS